MKKSYNHPTVSTIVVNQCLPLAGSGPVKVKSSINPAMKESFFHSCFGIDLLQGTGGKWTFVEKQINNDGRNVYTFRVTNLNNPFFKEAEIHVFEEKGANYTFYSKIPEWNHPFDVVFTIEKNLIYGEGYTEDVSIRRNRDKINKKEWLEWEIDDINIKIWWDIDDDRKYSLNLWTSFALFDNVKHLIPQNLLLTSDYKDDIIPKEEFLKNFFGVNILDEPDDSWEYEGMFDGRNRHNIYVKNELKDKFFNKCKILAFEGGGSNILWQPIPYDPAIPYQIALMIEHNLLGNTNMTFDQCVNKYEDTPSTSSIDLKDEDYNISINFGFDRKEITMTLWTQINKDVIIKKSRELYPERIIEDPNRAHLMPKEQFLSNFFGVDLMNAPDGNWAYHGFVDDDNPHHVFTCDTLNDEFFRSCVLLAVVNGGTLFSWGAIPDGDLDFLKVAGRIHQNLLGEEDFNIGDAITMYMDVILSKQDSIEINYEDYKICINLNRADGTFDMTLWTISDKTEMINKLLEQRTN